MEWKKLELGMLPEGEVLAANFNSGTYGYKELLIGYVSADGYSVVCENESIQLGDCSHYLSKDDLFKLNKQ